MRHLLTTHFNVFRRNTLPPEHRLRAARDLPDKVRTFLEKLATFKTLWPHSRLAGSYAQKMCVGDVKDVDFLIRVDGVPEGENMTPPREIIRDLAEALEGLAAHLGYAPGDIAVSTARRSVHVHFVGEDFHLDVVPCIAPNGLDKPLFVPCKKEKAWVMSDPLGYVRRLNEVNAEYGQNVKRLGRIFKFFVQHQMIRMRPKSYWLGALLLQTIKEKGFDENKSLAELFHWLVSEIYKKYKVVLDASTTKTPSVEDPMLGHNISWNWERPAFESFMRHLKEAIDWSEKALQNGIAKEKAIEYWRKIFGDSFPETVEEETKQVAAASAPGSGCLVTAAGMIVPAGSATAIGVIAPATRFHGGRQSAPRARRPVLNVGVQQAGVKRHFPGFRFRTEGTTGVWKGKLQPRPGSPVYSVTIRFRPLSPPVVRVTAPQISPDAPHVFHDTGGLCLYWARDLNWNSSMSLAETIVPWTAQWLLYYELWQETGKWLGPESPHWYPGRERETA